MANIALYRNMTRGGKLMSEFPLGNAPWDMRSFPGAEGVAARTRGAAAYSGTKSIYVVDNLNDAGPGSFREAVEGFGKEGRFVIFLVSGIILLESRLRIYSDYLTILGQTSPNGICTAGQCVEIGGDDNFGYHDIIVRHMRFRPGVDLNNVAPANAESFRIWKCHDIMVDHCSMSWGGDETVSVTTYGTDYVASVYNISISHCMITQGLTDAVAPITLEGNHGYGLLVNGLFINTPENSIDFHNSYWAHHNDRQPQLAGAGRFTVMNNVTYNFYASQSCKLYPYDTAVTQGNLFVNFTNNYVKPGPDTNNVLGQGGGNATELLTGSTLPSTPWEMLYMKNNFGVLRQFDTDPEWSILQGGTFSLLPESWRRLSPFPISAGVPITPRVMEAATAEAQAIAALADMGANKPRDSHDAEMVADFINGTGGLKATSTYPDDWPVYGNDPYPTDTDGDGIPDSFEIAQGFGVGTMDPLEIAPSGYLWIEEYSFLLAGDV